MSTTSSHDVAVFVGRFQPFHLGHLVLLRHALSIAPRAVVVIGSAHQARTPKNPFTWRERAEMIRLSLTADERERVDFLPVRDHYNETRWIAAVREGVQAIAGHSASVALVGHFKDATSAYLRSFPGWAVVSRDRAGAIDGTALRSVLFGSSAHDLDATLGALVEQAPATTLDFLRAWSVLPHFAPLVQEWQMLRAYQQAWSSAPYPPVFVTVDAVVLCDGHVLLIRRGAAPGKGLYAAPGGFIEARETVYQSAVRELREETGLNLLESTMQQALKEVAVFDHPDRSLRGRTITHAHFFALGERELPEVTAADDAQSAEWISVSDVAAMEDRFHDDHFHMLDHFLDLT